MKINAYKNLGQIIADRKRLIEHRPQKIEEKATKSIKNEQISRSKINMKKSAELPNNDRTIYRMIEGKRKKMMNTWKSRKREEEGESCRQGKRGERNRRWSRQ